MGKGARNREMYAEQRAEQKKQQAQENKKKKRGKIIGGVLAGIVAAGAIGTGLVYSLHFASGNYLRNDIVASTENFEVDNAMMTYYFRSAYVAMQSEYGDYFSMFTGIDTTASLKDQVSDPDTGTTWFDAILIDTMASVEGTLALAEEAKAAGIELSEQEHKYIEDSLQYATDYYLDDGVTEEDITKAMELSILAQKYTTHLANGMEYTDEELDIYYEENENDFKSVDYRVYDVYYKDPNNEETSTALYTLQDSQERVEALVAAKTEEEFEELITEMIKEQNPEITEEELTTELSYTVVEESPFYDDNDFSTWAFSDEAQELETFKDEQPDTFTTRVYFLTGEAERSEKVTADVRSISFYTTEFEDLTARDTKAQEVLDAYLADPTVENFIALADENSVDLSTMETGGLVEGVAQDTALEILDEWIFDSSRTEGDTEILSTDDAAYMLYYIGEGREEWEYGVIYTLQNEEYATLYEGYLEKHPVTFNTAALDNIPA